MGEGEKMAINPVHAAERKAFQLILKNVLKKAKGNRGEGYQNIINTIQKFNGDAWPEKSYENLRKTFASDGKWAQFFDRLLESVDVEYLGGLIMAFGFEGGFTGFKRVKKMREKYNCGIPW